MGLTGKERERGFGDFGCDVGIWGRLIFPGDGLWKLTALIEKREGDGVV